MTLRHSLQYKNVNSADRARPIHERSLATMTNEALMTQMRKQRADLIAVNLLLDSLMRALPREHQDAWLKEIRSLASTRQATLHEQGADEAAIRIGQHAIEQRVWRLEDAR